MPTGRQTSFLPDTSCTVAMLCTWHDFHEAALNEVERRLKRGELLVMAGHVLVETCSVLTRLPAPHRMSPTDAADLLARNFRERATKVLTASRYWELVDEVRRSQVAGGAVYDLLILSCAKAARVSALLTFNPRHFERLNPAPVEIIQPEA